MRVVKPVWAVVLMGVWAGRVTAEPADATRILADAGTAAKALKAVRYEAYVTPEGAWADRMVRMSATVVLERNPAADLPRLRVDALITPPGQPKSTHLQVAFDGKAATQADEGQKIWMAREMPLAMNVVSGVLPLLLLDLTSARPFEPDGNVTLSVQPAEQVDDQECDVVRFENPSAVTDWYFARTDHLPRRAHRTIKMPGGDAALSLNIKYLALNPDTTDVVFRFEQPEGYRDLSKPPAPGSGNLLEVGSAAPDWTLKTPDGQEVTLKSLRGKVVLLDFWATWCGPCKMAMPGVQRLFEKYKGKPVAIYGVNCWERGADPAAWWKKSEYKYPILLRGDLVATQYRVSGIPTFYLIGADGKIVYGFSGVGSEQELDRHIEEALKAASSQPTTQTATQPSSPSGTPATTQPATTGTTPARIPATARPTAPGTPAARPSTPPDPTTPASGSPSPASQPTAREVAEPATGSRPAHEDEDDMQPVELLPTSTQPARA